MGEGPLLSTADVYRTKGSHTIMVSCVDKEKLKMKLHYFPDRFLDFGTPLLTSHFSAHNSDVHEGVSCLARIP